MAEDYWKSSFGETKAARWMYTGGFVITHHYGRDSCMIQPLNSTSKLALLCLLIAALLRSGSILLLPVNAQPPSAAVVINSDGTVTPPDAPVQRNGSVYTFSGDVATDSDGLLVQRHDSVIIGNGFTISGNGTDVTGVHLLGVSNITVTCFNITGFDIGILIDRATGCTIMANRLVNNTCHVVLQGATGNTINGNNADLYKPGSLPPCAVLAFAGASNNLVTDNAFHNGLIGIAFLYSSNSNRVVKNSVFNCTAAVYVEESSDESIVENNLVSSQLGVMLHNCTGSGSSIEGNNINSSQLIGVYLNYTSNDVVRGNNITNGANGVYTEFSTNITVFHNNLINNTNQASNNASTIVWNEGYPYGGNYWSNYNDTDLYGGPYQNETGNDGIWDHPYVIDENNTDNYPLTEPLRSEYYTLTIIASTGGSTFPEPDSRTYEVRSVVFVTASPNTGYSFMHWLLDGEEQHGNNITLFMCSNHTLEAVFADTMAPNITTVSQNPAEDCVTWNDVVTINVTVIDLASGVKRVSLAYNNGSSWIPVNMTSIGGNAWTATIPTFPQGTNVTYGITVEDNAGNIITSQNLGYELGYPVAPEFTLPIMLGLLAVVTYLAVTERELQKRRHEWTSKGTHDRQSSKR
jgi:parallel beta-helix repeat protein